MTTCERHRDLIDRSTLLSEAVVRTYVRTAAAGNPRYGKTLLKYGAAVGKLVQQATLLGGEAWLRAAKACRITHLGLAALYLQAQSIEEACDVRLIQEAARLSYHLREIADTFARLPFEHAYLQSFRTRTGRRPRARLDRVEGVPSRYESES